MLKHFPIPPTFDLRMGTGPLGEAPLIEVDEHYIAEIALKRSLLTEDHAYYYQEPTSVSLPSWETIRLITDHLTRSHPESFQLSRKGDDVTFCNQLLGEEVTFRINEDASLPLRPLDWIGRHVQEDLILLNAAGEVVAGQLCFPSGWCLDEKIGKQFMEVHAPLPSVSMPMIQAANKLMERLPEGKPLTRDNWGFRLGDQLDLSSKHAAAYRQKLQDELPGMSMETFGRSIFLRIEHQTLTRLPSGFVLFTIHTYNSPLEVEVRDPLRCRNLKGFLSTTPEPLLAYKIITPYFKQLMDYLSEKESTIPA